MPTTIPAPSSRPQYLELLPVIEPVERRLPVADAEVIAQRLHGVAEILARRHHRQRQAVEQDAGDHADEVTHHECAEEQAGCPVDRACGVDTAQPSDQVLRPRVIVELLGHPREGEDDEQRHHRRVFEALDAAESAEIARGRHRFTINRQRCRRICRPRPPIMNGMITA